MMWAESSGRDARVTDPMFEQRCGCTHRSVDIKHLQLPMNIWTDGTADKTISYGAHSDLDAWMELCHGQLPEGAHQQQLLTRDSNNLTAARDAHEPPGRMQDTDRITSVFIKLADPKINEGQKLAKLKTTIPAGVNKHIAVAAMDCKQYGGLVQLVDAPLVGSLTGLSGGDQQRRSLARRDLLPPGPASNPHGLRHCSVH